MEAATWTWQGAPAGILEHPSQVGVFPDAKEPGDWVDVGDETFPAPETRSSYASVEA